MLERISFVVFVSTIVFLSYVAFEPYVRRFWPTTLISWSRLLGGRIRDPLVARDVLIGGVAGIVASTLVAFHTQLPPVLGLDPEPMALGAVWRAVDPRIVVGTVLSQFGGAVGASMILLLALVLFRLLTRRSWAAVALLFVLGLIVPNLGSPHFALDVALSFVVFSMILFVLLRVGLLGLVALNLFQSLGNMVLTLDPSSWVGASSMVALAVLLVVVGVAAIFATGGRPLLADEV